MSVRVIVLLLILHSAEIIAASFDCNKKLTAIEGLICADPIVSELDDQLDVAFSSAVLASQDSSSVIKNQRDWLISRNHCDSAECLIISYRTQIAVLTNKPDTNKLVTLFSKNDNLCSSYRDYIEHELSTRRQDGYMATPLCQRSFGSDFHEFASVQWVEIDPGDYKELTANAHRYASYAHVKPWGRPGVPDASLVNEFDAIQVNHKHKWYRAWLGVADIYNTGRTTAILKFDSGGCGKTTTRAPHWRVPIVALDVSGRTISQKSEVLLGTAIEPRNKGTEMENYLDLSLVSYDVFRFSGETYFDKWRDNWTPPGPGRELSFFGLIDIYKANDDKSELICAYRVKKNVLF